MAAIFLLIGTGLLYTSYGTLNMAQLAQLIGLDEEQTLVPAADGLHPGLLYGKERRYPLPLLAA
jgi:hypothetical protein